MKSKFSALVSVERDADADAKKYDVVICDETGAPILADSFASKKNATLARRRILNALEAIAKSNNARGKE